MVASQTPRKLLVVDDEPLVRQTITFCLREHCEVTAVGSGEEAIALASREAFPVVVLDLCMNGLSGIETLRRLKEIRENQNVIILTGFESAESAIAALNYGAFNYLTKPFERSHLQSVVARGFETYELMEQRERTMRERLLTVHDTFFSMLCHEFNTPLNSIIGFAELLSHDANDPERAEWVRNIRDSGERLHAILMEIVDYVSASHLAMAGVEREFDPSLVLAPIAKLSEFNNAKLTFRDHIGSGLTMAGADRAILLVVKKLIRIASGVSNRARLTTIISSEAGGNGEVFRVVIDDTGLRPSPTDGPDLERLFEPYEHGTLLPPSRSLGLELATCRRIAEYAHGTVRCALRIDGEFQLIADFPVRRVAGAASAESLSPSI